MDPMLRNNDHPSVQRRIPIEEGAYDTAVPPTPSEIDRLAAAILYNREAIYRLEEKLHVVNARQGQKIGDGTTPANAPTRPHISDIIDQLSYNNKELDRLSNELVL